ncbi:ATP-binding protein [Cytobacillus spartinae]
MLAEKLLLHVLIIFAPILIYSFFIENKGKQINSYICGLLQGGTALLCMTFPVYNFELYWDLRYVPLVLAFLYSGPIAGGIVFLFILGTRTFIGGEALLFGYISAIISVIVPFAYSILNRFWKKSPRKRILTAITIGFWPAVMQLGILIFWFVFNPSAVNFSELISYILIFGFINILAIGFAAKLNEMIIERIMMKQEIRRAEKFNTLGELAASIAHEVRNPLTVVKGFLQLMQQKEKGENYQYLTLVLGELGRAEAIINDYLSFAKPQYEKKEKFLIKGLLLDVQQLLEPLALKQGVELRSILDSDQLLLADRDQFKQAIVNIIKNAIEATNNGGEVIITLEEKNDMVRIRIKDSGKGMTKDQLSRLGTLFYTTKDKGTGLGTMVSIRIIESMNGKISYRSEEGSGTEVTIQLRNPDEVGRNDEK